MRDRELRAAMHEHLAREHEKGEGTLVVDEFSIDGLDRIDLATVNGVMTGYELKSAHDRLARLERQVHSYGRVMDYLFLVTTPAHLVHARSMIPPWWGIISAKDEGDLISLKKTRRARPNPRLDASSVARLLWRDEALAILSSRGLDKGFRTRSRNELCERLATELHLEELRQEVRLQLKARHWSRESPVQQQNDATSPFGDKIPHFLARRYQMQRR